MIGMISHFLPEGRRLTAPDNLAACATVSALRSARDRGMILEGRALSCSTDHDLTVAVGPFTGRIPREDTALGVAEGTTKEIAILSRVGKPVCFLIESIGQQSDGSLCPVLSRRAAQQLCLEQYIRSLTAGDVIPARVTHLEGFGCFVDIGCGVPSLIGIENISVSRIPHPDQRFRVGQAIFAVVQELDPKLGRVYLTHRELLGTWEENAAGFTVGETVVGIVRSVEEYGTFIEIAPNLAGLAESCTDLVPGQAVSVYIKNILPEKMKIKLVIVNHALSQRHRFELKYFITEGHLDHWVYSTPESPKRIETDFAAAACNPA